ncbi:uncharacterized protein F4817DRAFT_317301 [Daldinia loculata]|uniref:uncharacterized protein n=1 Tax=Daldinia loculata TaxID=103429 RepID=UPI0020C53EA7|nr:uncharacterized protein F4817DRAFT_317301 [Daldinia loculata]KAI1645922.1 hypothetical protein F4817DRAFT_317301 [Daldinia loculata]
MYLKETDVIEPPEGGWPNLSANLQSLSKTDEVISLLYHLPYIRKPSDDRDKAHGAPGCYLADWQKLGSSVSNGGTTREILKLVSEGSSIHEEMPPPHVISLTAGGRYNPVFLLDIKLGVVHWYECPSEIRYEPSREPIEDDPYDYAPEKEAEWRAEDSSRDLIIPRWRLYLSLRGSSLEAIPQTRFEGDGQVRFELELLSEIRNMKATIAHDKVYSLYSVFQAMGINLPSPDYGKDAVKVFEEATLAYIRSRQNLNVIAITLPPDPSSGSPSWVPDWLTPGRNGSALIWKITDFDAQYHSTTPILTDNTRGGKLGVMGKVIGKINKRIRCPLVLDQALSHIQAYQEVISACLDWRHSISSLTRYSPGKDPKLVGQALLRPYHANVPNSKLGTLYRWALHGDGTSPPEDETTLEAITEKRKLRENWVIFTLDTGYCGTAHHNCQAGDDIVLLKSLNPLVLRPQSKSHEFRIVAPAYCEGAMNGDMNSHNDELEEIILV